ncbi:MULTISPECIES: hypothetical protein [Neisseria]|mgnify:FL=1|uniref:Phage protein n=1 Tax=Neisseria oralis TaxID=1107316 RepID=A0ABW8Q0M2_9NEIS|nr:hypothetical protein [Neisseria dentiae]MCQ9325790.1 hypothetical protein [Neisseria dentiae]
MNGDTPITVEYVFGTLVSFLIALLWYWVKSISDGLKEARKDRDELLGRLHSVETSYQTKAEAKDNRNEILNLLREIKADLKEVGQKIERKADK